MTSDDTYVVFARGLSARVADRVKGLGERYERIVAARPEDIILGAFLTPQANRPRDGANPPGFGAADAGEESADPDELGAKELPGDSPQEVSSIGIEWLLPIAGARGALLHAKFTCNVYVRRIPDVTLATEHATWRLAKGETDRRTDLVPVWTQERIAIPIEPIDLEELLKSRTKRISLDRHLGDEVKHISASDLYLARVPIRPTAAELQAEAYRARAAHGTKPLLWSAVLDVRTVPVPTDPSCVRVIVRVINTTPGTSRGQDDFSDPNLYAAQLAIQVPLVAHRPSLFDELPQSYRYDLAAPAIGINCQAELVRGDVEGQLEIRTETVPRKEVGRLEPRNLGDAEPNFAALDANPLPILRRIHEHMKKYQDGQWRAKVEELEGSAKLEAQRDLQRFGNEEVVRFGKGIELLADDRFSDAGRAFRLMNQTMLALGARSPRRYASWRLFQIVFIVAQLPELVARRADNPYGSASDDTVDLLWFAAGGGKTEAFLGLLLWQLFFDRLTGKAFGVTAFLRFPLRLLAYQQLQRLANALAEADKIREYEHLPGRPFSLGYFIGESGESPNEISDDLHKRLSSGVEDEAPRIQACPYCSSPVRLHYEAAQRWYHHRCTNEACRFSKVALPIAHTDADCYRYLPSVIVSTVDKFALFGQNVRFANLLGRITAQCPKHGATFMNSNSLRCPGAKLLVNSTITSATCGDTPLDFGPFLNLGPSLLIQDELHLLTEELGIFDAHYETAIMEAMTSLGQRPWKIIAATATISTFAEHINHLYVRAARQFPAPGPEVYDSFYYQVAEGSCGRIFLGVLGVNRAHTPSVSKLMGIIYSEIQEARKLGETDTSAALERYGLPPMSVADFGDILFYYEILLTYVLTKKGSDQVAEAVESRVKHELASEEELRIETFNGGVDLVSMTSTMKEIEEADQAKPVADRVRGVIATNIISHGVDVERFNLMLFAGFTRLVAEYIQASARVGRRRPGIVFMVVTPQSERDRSIYQQFAKFHEYVDRLVDPSALNRWPVPAMHRTVPGLLAGYLMAVASGLCHRRLDTVESVQRAYASAQVAPLTEAAVLSWLDGALACSRAPAAEPYRKAVRQWASNLYAGVINAAPQTQGGPPRTLGKHLNAMRSLRDVDDPAFIDVESQAARRAIRAFLGGA